ncbi:hypothetical protein BDM02DRAFT_3249177 [Thelephora ganbajun]|uniref:Uncharacterized protein n=1 Tax=Thelephora ganbajun TaxID=370292 RepID=A0ACB6YXN4_THEGA|nr:hypothetical protein BDM02DRAFT_3249177 [Thelephora ganbajun]
MSSSRQVSVAPTTPTPSLRSTPVSPCTPSRTTIGRRPLNPHQFSVRQPLREDKIFVPFKAALREAKTLVSFVYKADRCQGKLVPIPYDDGKPIVPSMLIAHIDTQGWETNPTCFCVIRGHDRVAVLYVPRTANSPAFGQVCLVCPESECPYFVNIQEMYEHPESRRDLLSIEDNAIALPEPSPKKHKLRIASWKARASGVTPIIDQFDFISKLFSRTGMTRGEFDSLFHLCSKCNRVSRIPHSCVIEINDDSELDDDLEVILAN